jgi:hypothetical protein
MGKIWFEAEMQTKTPLFPPHATSQHMSESQALLAQLPPILCYPTDECMSVGVQAARVVQMNKTRVLEINIQSGRNDIHRGQLNLRAGSAGLRLMIAEATTAAKSVRLVKSRDSGSLELENLAANSNVTIALPFDLESNLVEITVGIDFQYTTTQGTFQYYSNPCARVDLVLDISVHDLFQDELLFSRFQIRASHGVPLLISSIELASSDVFTAEGRSCNLLPMLVHPHHDGTMLYTIQPSSMASARQSRKLERPLEFEVEYLAYDEIVLAALQWSLSQALDQSAFKKFKYPLSQVVARFSQELDPDALSRTAMLRRLEPVGYEEMGWTQLLEGFDPSVRQAMEAWLRQWHAQATALILNDSNAARFLPSARVLRISVPLPHLQTLHTVRLDLPTKDLVAQGSMLIGTISVHYTLRWDGQSDSRSVPSVEMDRLDFILDVDAAQDEWLLGGDRRCSYQATVGEVVTFKVMLVPLKTGRLLLPDVRVRGHGHGEDGTGCETDFRSAGETVMVVPGVRGTTLAVRELIAGAEVTVVGSERQ